MKKWFINDTLQDYEDDFQINLEVYPNSVKLSEEQVIRYNENPNDLKYIFEGVETPAPELTLEQKKEKKKQDLLIAFESLQVIQNGFNHTIITEENPEGIEKIWNFDENTIMNIVQQQAEAWFNENADEFQVSTSSKEAIVFNRAEYKAFGSAYSGVIAPLKRQLSQKQNEIDLTENQTQLDAVSLVFV